MSILFASLESTDVENEIDEEEDPESNQTGKNCVIVKREWILKCIFMWMCVFYLFIYRLVL